MKINKLITLLIFTFFSLLSCSKDDATDESSDETIERSDYHVVASVDGAEVEFINLLNDYEPIYSFFNSNAIYIEVYSQQEAFPYVLTMSLFEEEIALGTHELSTETVFDSDGLVMSFNEAALFNYVSDSVFKTGSITFTEIDRENNILAGNFELEVEITSYKDQDNPEIYDVSVTEGSFRIKFPNE